MESLWTVPWNDEVALAEAIDAAGDRLAAVICEVVPGSGGVLEPRPGYLERLLRQRGAAGALVIFDEVMTGFRLAPGGAQERYGVTPDITALGKVIGGGMSVAAFGGSRELMRVGGRQPRRPRRHVHGLAARACRVGCRSLADRRRARALRRARDSARRRWQMGSKDIFAAAGIDGHVRRVGSMLQPFLAARPDEEPRDVNEAAALQPAERYLAFCDGLEARGVYAHRYALGRWFVSLAHGPAEIEQTLDAVRGAVEDLVE